MSDKPCKVSLIVAVAENGVIGVNNTIPWKCSSDMKYFRKTTMGHPVIMGRKTWESLGKPLKGRGNIVLTRNQTFQAPGATVVPTVESALEQARSFVGDDEACEAMIIGGKAIYDEFLSRADRIYFTLIHMSPKGDTYFFDLAQLAQLGWKEISCDHQQAGERDEADMSFIVLKK